MPPPADEEELPKEGTEDATLAYFYRPQEASDKGPFDPMLGPRGSYCKHVKVSEHVFNVSLKMEHRNIFQFFDVVSPDASRHAMRVLRVVSQGSCKGIFMGTSRAWNRNHYEDSHTGTDRLWFVLKEALNVADNYVAELYVQAQRKLEFEYSTRALKICRTLCPLEEGDESQYLGKRPRPDPSLPSTGCSVF